MARLPLRNCLLNLFCPAQAVRLRTPLNQGYQGDVFKTICLPPQRSHGLLVRCCSSTAAASALPSESPPITVQVSIEATASCVPQQDLNSVASRIEGDALLLVQHALATCGSEYASYSVSSKPHELSIVLCDDEYMTAVNREWRGLDRPTDVLSFEIPQDEFSADLPVVTLGDIIISLDTAARQAQERQCTEGSGYTLHDEVRVLLVHGILHLLGYDHEVGPQAAQVMAEQEVALMQHLGWQGTGLIDAVGVDSEEESVDSGSTRVHGATGAHGTANPGDGIKLVCLDMDGTMLDSESKVSSMTAKVLRQCLSLEGITVMLATGKARPAAMSACSAAGLAGFGGIVSEGGPGVFLQGLATYGPDGALLPGPSLEWSVVETVFRFAEEQRISCCAFLGDTCATTFMTPYLEELHTRYYEPLAEVLRLDALLAGPKVKKILLMTEPREIDAVVKPHLERLIEGTTAETTQAVDSMLEVVPRGVNKWVGISRFLESAGLEPASVLAIGDGMNDYHMLLHAGVSVAVANAKQPLKDLADRVFDSNDDDGVAKALQYYLLSDEFRR